MAKSPILKTSTKTIAQKIVEDIRLYVKAFQKTKDPELQSIYLSLIGELDKELKTLN